MVPGAKDVAKKIQKKSIRKVGGTEQNLLQHLLYAGTFVHCADCLVKLTLGLNR
jgi:hypothetical protein